eukprot:11206379-Lingulodinium_polyedra.AAC.1
MGGPAKLHFKDGRAYISKMKAESISPVWAKDMLQSEVRIGENGNIILNKNTSTSADDKDLQKQFTLRTPQ